MIAPRLSVWPPLPPAAHLLPVRPGPPPFPLGEENCRLYARARHALWHGVQALGLSYGDEVLVPSYHHGSEIEALRRAGLGCRWYDGDDALRPTEDELESLLGPQIRALYLIHYLGFPQDSERWRRWCDERDLLLLEDAAQAWLATQGSRPVGVEGDLAIFCLYKTVGISEGAALVSRRPPPAPAALDPRFGVNVVARRHAAWITQRSALANAAVGRLSKPVQYSAARDRDLGDPLSGPWASVAKLWPRLGDPHVAAVRRAHYAVLLEALGDRVEPPFDVLPEGASPFAFPLTSPEKLPLLERLERSGIRGLDLWSVPHPSLPADRFPRAARRRDAVVGLPVHQELRLDDLERITAAVIGKPRPPTRPELRFEALGPLDVVREEWTRLAERVGNVFASWEFAACWWRHFGSGQQLELHGCRDARGELAAIVPLYRSSTPGLRALRLLGHGVADQLDLICAPEDRGATARAVRSGLEARSDWDLCLAERLPAEAGWDALLGAPAIGREPSPVLDIGGLGWDDFLGTLSRNLRQQIRRRERKLVREHGLRFRLCEDRDRLDEDLEQLFALHDARWGAASTAFGGNRRGFHREFASVALERGWLRLWLAEIDGETVATWYGFRYGGSEWYYQAGRDPRLSRLSVGWVLLVHSIRAAVEDGQAAYRFLRGREGFKYRLANRDAPVETLVLSRGAGGRAAASIARGAARSPAARRALARALG